MILAGVDDAGRGSVIGPLVIAAVAVHQSKVSELRKLGVKDSKLLSPAKRRRLFRQIKKIADGISVWKINPQRIDQVVLYGERLFKLNYLEARYMALALSRLDYDVAYVDCCDTDEARFGNLVAQLISRLGKRNVTAHFFDEPVDRFDSNIKSEHHADRNYPVVSAASVVAKVTRDDCISILRKSHGALGSGYPSDSETVDYLKNCLDRSEKLPPFTRLSWDTITRLEEESEIRTIEEFFG